MIELQGIRTNSTSYPWAVMISWLRRKLGGVNMGELSRRMSGECQGVEIYGENCLR